MQTRHQTSNSGSPTTAHASQLCGVRRNLLIVLEDREKERGSEKTPASPFMLVARTGFAPKDRQAEGLSATRVTGVRGRQQRL